MLGMTQNDLAEASSISARTIIEFEKGKRLPHNSTLRLLRLTFEEAGITFIHDDGQGQGLILKKK